MYVNDRNISGLRARTIAALPGKPGLLTADIYIVGYIAAVIFSENTAVQLPVPLSCAFYKCPQSRNSDMK